MPRGPAGPPFLCSAVVLQDLDLARHVVLGGQRQLSAMKD